MLQSLTPPRAPAIDATPRSTAFVLLCVAAFAAAMPIRTVQAMPFGALASDQAQLNLVAGPLIGDQFNQYWTSGAEAPVTTLVLQSQNIDPGTQSANGVFYDNADQPYYVSASMYGYANATGSINGGTLRAYVDASAPDQSVCARAASGYIFFCTESSAAASTYEGWLDTLDVTGPTGAPLTLRVTDQLLGNITNGYYNSATGSVTGATDVLQLCVAGLGICYNPTTTITASGAIDQTRYGYLTVYAGETLTLEHQLVLQTYVGIPTAYISGAVDFADTANSFLDILTPGGGLVAASGVDYSTPAINSTPEPATLALTVIGLAAMLRRGASAKRIAV